MEVRYYVGKDEEDLLPELPKECKYPLEEYIENIVFLVTKDCNEVILHTGAAKLVAINIDSIDKFAEWCKWCKDILTKKEVERLKTQKE